MLETSVALTVTSPLVTWLASTSLPPLMLASTVLPVMLVAATAASATLIDTPPAPPAVTPTAWPLASIELLA